MSANPVLPAAAAAAEKCVFGRNYIACDFGALFRAAGFECGTKYVVSATKTLSFVKPEGHSGSQNDAFTVPSAAAVDGSYTAMGTPELN